MFEFIEHGFFIEKEIYMIDDVIKIYNLMPGKGVLFLVFFSLIFIVKYYENVGGLLSIIRNRAIDQYERYGALYLAMKTEDEIAISFIEQRKSELLLTRLTGIYNPRFRNIYMRIYALCRAHGIVEKHIRLSSRFITDRAGRLRVDYNLFKRTRRKNRWVQLGILIGMMVMVLLSFWTSTYQLGWLPLLFLLIALLLEIMFLLSIERHISLATLERVDRIIMEIG